VTFEIGGDVDVDKVMAEIRARIEEKKKGLYTEAEIREIAERRLDAVLEAHDLRSDLIQDFRAEPSRWNFGFETETIYRSSRGLVGRGLETLRGLLKPVQKLFWNPNPMIAALSRQSDLNKYYVHLFHNLSLELTRLNLEVQELKNRNLQLQGRLELLTRREKTLESLVAYRDPKDGAS
jgi:DNA repair exonuclease SbcCD ATPase subunit